MNGNTKKLLLIGLLTLAFSSMARADLNVGDEVPGFQVGNWYNLPSSMKKLSPKDLKGQIVIVQFWTVWDGASDKILPLLIRVHDKYKSKGVVIVAISEDGKSRVQPFIEKERVNFVTASEGQPTFREYGVTEVPSSYLVDPDGKLVWKGHPAVLESELEKLLKEKPAKGGGIFSEKSAASAFKSADKLYRQKRYVEAMSAFEKVSVDYKGSKVAGQAKAQIKKMKGNSKIVDVLKKHEAETQSKKWLEIARTCSINGEKKDAAKYYDKIINTYGDYELAKLARTERASLGVPKAESDDSPSKSAKKAVSKDADADDEDSEESSDDEDSEEDSDE